MRVELFQRGQYGQLAQNSVSFGTPKSRPLQPAGVNTVTAADSVSFGAAIRSYLNGKTLWWVGPEASASAVLPSMLPVMYDAQFKYLPSAAAMEAELNSGQKPDFAVVMGDLPGDGFRGATQKLLDAEVPPSLVAIYTPSANGDNKREENFGTDDKPDMLPIHSIDINGQSIDIITPDDRRTHSGTVTKIERQLILHNRTIPKE